MMRKKLVLEVTHQEDNAIYVKYGEFEACGSTLKEAMNNLWDTITLSYGFYLLNGLMHPLAHWFQKNEDFIRIIDKDVPLIGGLRK